MVTALAPAYGCIICGRHLRHGGHGRHGGVLCWDCWDWWCGLLLRVLRLLFLRSSHTAIARELLLGGSGRRRRHCFGCHAAQECCVTLHGGSAQVKARRDVRIGVRGDAAGTGCTQRKAREASRRGMHGIYYGQIADCRSTMPITGLRNLHRTLVTLLLDP